MHKAYYNEFDPNAAEWLRQLIKLGHIAPGDVDERSITEVKEEDLEGYTQCHFFAGIGIWSHALRKSGWPDDKPVWTGSCPCQPFSSAGKQEGTKDERHLWPAFRALINIWRPPVVFGEQVSGRPVTGSLKSEGALKRLERQALDQFAEENSDAWLKHVQLDMESRGYGVGAVTFPACGLGAPHQRKRLYWVAENELENATGNRRSGEGARGSIEEGWQPRPKQAGQLSDGLEGRSVIVSMADSECEQRPKVGVQRHRKADAEKNQGAAGEPAGRCGISGLADSVRTGRQDGAAGDGISGQVLQQSREGREFADNSSSSELADTISAGHEGRLSGRQDTQRENQHGRTGCDGAIGAGHSYPMPTKAHWRNADWLKCRDGKWRPVEPGTFPLADGSPSELVSSSDLSTSDVKSTKEAKAMRLKGYGNAIVASQAQAFIEAYIT